MQGYRTNTKYTGSLGYNSVRYFTSRIGWVSLKRFSGIDIDVILRNCTKPPRKINPHLVIDLLGINTFRWNQRLQLHNFFVIFKRVFVVFTLKTVLTSIQYLLSLTLQVKETNFRGHKLQNKVQKNNNKIKRPRESPNTCERNMMQVPKHY